MDQIIHQWRSLFFSIIRATCAHYKHFGKCKKIKKGKEELTFKSPLLRATTMHRWVYFLLVFFLSLQKLGLFRLHNRNYTLHKIWYYFPLNTEDSFFLCYKAFKNMYFID